MKTFFKYLRPYKKVVVLALMLAAVNQCFSMLDPYFFGEWGLDKLANHPYEYGYYKTEQVLAGPGIAKGTSNGTAKAIAKGGTASREVTRKVWVYKGPRTQSQFIWDVMAFLGVLIGVAMVSRIAKAFQDYYGQIIVQKFGATIFTDGLRHSMGLPFADFEDQRSGETLSTLTKVRTDTEKFILSFINVLFGILVGVIFVSIYSFSLHWSIMPIYVLGMVALSLLTSLLSRKIKRIQKTIVGETNALAGSTTESLRNIELVKSLGLKEQEVNRLNKNTFKILALELRKVKSLRALSFIQGTFVNFLRQCIMFLLLWLVFRGRLTGGEVMTMVFYSFFIFGPLQELGNIILTYREAEASLINFEELMSKHPELPPVKPLHLGVVRELAFKNVVFQHRTAHHLAVDHISFEVRTGETIAFVGPSGSGKTTLMKLIVGLYRAQSGQIMYNGLEENLIDFEDLRRQIGFVTQDTQLFSGTIKENLLFVYPGASEEDLLEALRKSACMNLLSRAEKGIDTMIGEGGLKLSGGEKQRLSIARALLRHPALLIFDEATSALDSLTEEDITRTIREISIEGDQITILIAHRLSTIMHADRIYVLEKGEVEEVGTHETLLASKGLYYAMWRQQIGERKYAAPVAVNS